MSDFSAFDRRMMQRALELAEHGRGCVEPNPLVGCVLVRDGEIIGEGWHRRFGGDHAEVEALHAAELAATTAATAMASTGAARRHPVAGATAYVTLEPCCHFGKTPPCTEALIHAGVARVVIAAGDPFPAVAGGGIRRLQSAGVTVELGLLADEARALNAPYEKLVRRGRPWIIAKWAMTLDGKIATHSGDSRWISNEASRAVVHALRGRVDAVMIGSRTAACDDPLLTARPPGPRTATRIVVDGQATLRLDSRLVQTALDVPVLIAAAESAPQEKTVRLAAAGCEVLVCPGADHADRLRFLLDELGRRRMTNVLVEGGGRLLGGLFDLGEIDEVHAFIAPKLIGGEHAPSPLAGLGLARMADARVLTNVRCEILDGDMTIFGRFDRNARS